MKTLYPKIVQKYFKSYFDKPRNRSVASSITEEELIALEAQAVFEGRNRSQMIRLCVVKYLLQAAKEVPSSRPMLNP